MKNGNTVKYNRLLRSGTLCSATEEDIHILIHKYELKTIIDLRTLEETMQTPDPVIPGVKYININIIDPSQKDYDHFSKSNSLITSTDPGRKFLNMLRAGVLSEDMYTCFFQHDTFWSAIRIFFKILIDNEEGSVLWHCTGGKDRTGLFSVILLILLGADKKEVLEDFGYSNIQCKSNIDKAVSLSRAYTDDDSLLEQVRFLAGVSVEKMANIFTFAEKNGLEPFVYFKKMIGLSEEEVIKLRKNYTF